MVKRLAIVLVVLGLGVTIGACFSLSIVNGSIACSDDPTRPCPKGYACVHDRCWLPATLDGGTD
jgi:hypothetical protein